MNRNPKTLVLPEQTNREDLYLQVAVFDDDTGDAIDMTSLGWVFQFEIRRLGDGRGSGPWSDEWYDWSNGQPEIVLTNGNGPGFVNIVDVGQLLIWASESTMRKLRHRTYRANLVANDGTRQFQVFAATLPIQNGGVTN